MKSIVLAVFAAIVCCASVANADQLVNGYVRRDGTYVAPHYRSSPNSTQLDNFSTEGNTNPYTGQQGTRQPQYQQFYQPQRQPSCGYNAYNQFVCR